MGEPRPDGTRGGEVRGDPGPDCCRGGEVTEGERPGEPTLGGREPMLTKIFSVGCAWERRKNRKEGGKRGINRAMEGTVNCIAENLHAGGNLSLRLSQ